MWNELDLETKSGTFWGWMTARSIGPRGRVPRLRSALFTVALGTGLFSAIAAVAAHDQEARVKWWRDAKLGLFVHWGPVSLKGTEISWSRAGERRGFVQNQGKQIPVEVYDNLYRQFNPTQYNAHEWVDIAQKAGMKYLVFTARHVDGFSMWDTQASAYRITAPESPFGRDVVKELADACHDTGFHFGLYYAQPDWHHPDAFTTDRHGRYLSYLQDQVRELMTHYGRVDVLWFDGIDKTASDYGSVELARIAHTLQPQILINNRNALPEDFDTPEQLIGRMQVDRPWESCVTLGTQWSFKPNDSVKSLDELLRILITTVTGDGNLLLDVGPMSDGRIEPRQAKRLEEIGTWLGEHGEAVYETRGGPWANGFWGGSTYRGRTIYVHLLEPPVAGRLRLGPLPEHIRKAAVMGRMDPVAFTQDKTGVTLTLKAGQAQSPVTVLILETEEPVAPGQVIRPTAGVFADQAIFGSARTAAVRASASSRAPARAADGSWSVLTAAESNPWLILDLGTQSLVTAVSAVPAGKPTFEETSLTLAVEISTDARHWVEAWHGSYGLPAWEIAIPSAAGGDQPGQAARFVRISLRYASQPGPLAIGSVKVYAK